VSSFFVSLVLFRVICPDQTSEFINNSLAPFCGATSVTPFFLIAHLSVTYVLGSYPSFLTYFFNEAAAILPYIVFGNSSASFLSDFEILFLERGSSARVARRMID